MLVKFFKGGTGKSASPVEYLTRETDSRGVIREPLPEIIKGNPQQTIQLIDSLDFKYKFHSGVISFAPEDAPTEAQQQAIIDSFEKTAFAGLEPDQYDILWVRHSHTSNGRIELHFVTPRVELTTGKSMSIAPPGWQNYYCHWRDKWNYEHQWSDPTDPTRARTYQPGYQALRDAQDKRLELAGLPVKKKEDYRKVITELHHRKHQTRKNSRQRRYYQHSQQCRSRNYQNRNKLHHSHQVTKLVKESDSKEEFMTHLGDLDKDLQQRLVADRKEIEQIYKEELEKLKQNLAKESQSVLNSIRADTNNSNRKSTLPETMSILTRSNNYEPLNQLSSIAVGE